MTLPQQTQNEWSSSTTKRIKHSPSVSPLTIKGSSISSEEDLLSTREEGGTSGTMFFEELLDVLPHGILQNVFSGFSTPNVKNTSDSNNNNNALEEDVVVGGDNSITLKAVESKLLAKEKKKKNNNNKRKSKKKDQVVVEEEEEQQQQQPQQQQQQQQQTKSEKKALSNVRCPPTSIYRGVSRCTKDGRWQARIRIKQNVIYLGRYDNEVAAAKKYDDAVRTHYATEARIAVNFLTQEDQAIGRLSVEQQETNRKIRLGEDVKKSKQEL